jgi:hypothetical protein
MKRLLSDERAVQLLPFSQAGRLVIAGSVEKDVIQGTQSDRSVIRSIEDPRLDDQMKWKHVTQKRSRNHSLQEGRARDKELEVNQGMDFLMWIRLIPFGTSFV